MTHCKVVNKAIYRLPLVSTGLTTEQAEESFLLEASQGDSISGKITREEAASVVAVALNTTASKGQS